MTPTTLSDQPRLANTQEILPYMLALWQSTDDIPQWGTPGRAAKLREFARSEPILSGALSSMVSKACSLDWQVVGGRNRVKQYQELLAEAEDGAGWQSVLARWVQDYFNTDNGGFLELGRYGKNGPVAGLYHVDAECLGFTGSVSYPYVYTPKLTSARFNRKNAIKWTATDVARIVDMESPDEAKYKLGFCAVSRAIRASQVLLALYTYDEEKLADMPMPGVVSVTGMTMEELKAAFALYQATRESKGQYFFKALLWLAAQESPQYPIKADFTSFAGLPENFDREQTFSLYIYTLALVFGVDAREFWPATQSGATKGEAEVQAQKAKGKGFGQMLSAIERALNWSVLPEGIEFQFDRRNDDDDLAREIWRGQAIKNVRSLWEPAPATGAGIITMEEARKMLVELQAAPDWLAPEERITMHSLDRQLPSETSPTPEGPQEKPQVAPASSAGPRQPERQSQDEKVVQAAQKARLDMGEDLVAVRANGDTYTLWTPKRIFVMPVFKEAAQARRDAAIAHLQAAGLIMTDGEVYAEPTTADAA